MPIKKGKKGIVIDAGTPPTDPVYDASHPDESTKKRKIVR